MTKKTTLTLTTALALTLVACTPASATILGDVDNVDIYAQDVLGIVSDLGQPELADQLVEVLDNPIKGVEGTPAQTVLATTGLEEFFEDYAQATGYSTDFERNLFACHVDNDPVDIQVCIKDLESAMGE